MEELYRIIIFPKNKKSPTVTIDNVDEYYCTDRMFYAHEKSGITHYYSLDSIEEIMARPIQVKKEDSE